MRPALVAITVFAAIIPITVAGAQSTVDTVRNWGLIGEWSTEDCKLPLAVRQRQTVWYRVDPDGTVVYDADHLALVEAAEVTPEGLLSMRLISPTTNEKRVNVLERNAEGIRPVMSRNAKHQYSIKDGRFTGSGELSKVLKRCD